MTDEKNIRLYPFECVKCKQIIGYNQDAIYPIFCANCVEVKMNKRNKYEVEG